MPHKRNPAKEFSRKNEFNLRKAARSVIEAGAHYDRYAAELVCQTNRLEVMRMMPKPSGGSAGEIDVSQIPDVIHGEVLEDQRGRGTFQRKTS